MASNLYIESLISSAKRLKISPQKFSQQRALHQKNNSLLGAPRSKHNISKVPTAQQTRLATHVAPQSDKLDGKDELRSLRLPKAVQAVFLAPLKRAPTHGIPVCDLQIRSYSVRNLEAFADFCLRAAYYLNLPAKGAVPLPRITERWTVPRSNFVHKKSQENFERITVRRLIQIQDGHPETVAIWLAYIQANRYYGVGLKANVFEHGKLDVVEQMDQEGERLQKLLGEGWQGLDLRKRKGMSDQAYAAALFEEPFKAQSGAFAGMGGIQKQPTGRVRFRKHRLSDEQAGIARQRFAPENTAVLEEVASKAIDSSTES